MVSRRAVRAGTATALLAAALVACSSSPSCACGNTPPSTGRGTPHPVTDAEADRLAITRFDNYRGTGVRFTTSLASAQGPLSITGDVDYRRKLGYAEIVGSGSSFTVQWDGTELVAWPPPAGTVAKAGPPPAALPTTHPSSRVLNASATAVDSLFAVLLTLGQDRPDNAQLIAQDGARWLRSAVVDGVRVDVIQGPRETGSSTASTTTYWIDATGRLRRLQVHFGGGAATSIDIDAAAYRTFPAAPQLTR